MRQMRSLARAEYAARVPLCSFEKQHHRECLVRAISNVLSIELSLFTFAQIIDGLPIADVAWDRRYPGLHHDHILDDHEELCPGAMEKVQEFYRDWDPNILRFSPKVPITVPCS